MITVIICGVSAISAAVYLVSPSRIQAIAIRSLEGMTGAEVNITSVKLSYNGTVALNGVQLKLPNAPKGYSKLLDAELVRVQYHLSSLLWGKRNAKQIVFSNATIHVTEELTTGKYNYQTLRELQQPGQPGQPGPPMTSLPEVFLRSSRVRFGEFQDGVYTPLGTIGLSGKLTEADAAPSVYHFALMHRLSDDSPFDDETTITGKFNIRHWTATAMLERIRLDTLHAIALPKRLRFWYELVQPELEVDSALLTYDPAAEPTLRAELHLRAGQATLPYETLSPRLTEVTGDLKLIGDRIEFQDITGRIEGLRYEINGHVDGLTSQTTFAMSFDTAPFAISKEPRFLPALSDNVRKLFAGFTPSGTFAAHAQMRRDDPGGAVSYSGTLDVADAQLNFPRFQYPLRDVHGSLRFTDSLVEVVGLRGIGPTGAEVLIQGSIAPPVKDAAVHMTVMAKRGPADQALYDAMPPHYRRAVNLFFDEQAYNELIGLKVIQTPEKKAQRLEELQALRLQNITREDASLEQDVAELERLSGLPLFELGGKAGVVAQIERAYGPNQKLRTTIILDMAGLSILYKHWPYPLQVTSGKLLIRPDKVVAQDIVGQGLTGATIRISGVLLRDPEDRSKMQPDLRVEGDQLHTDNLLLASVRSDARAWLQRLHLDATLAGKGRIYWVQDSGIDFEIDLNLENAHAQPNAGRYGIDQVNGSVTLKRNRVRVNRLKGRHGDSELTLQCNGGWGPEGPHYKLLLDAVNLDLREPLIDLLPPGSAEALRLSSLEQRHHPDGRVDAQMSLSTTPDGQRDYRLTISPRQLTIDLNGARVDLRQITGSAAITPDHIQIDNLAGLFGTGGFTASGKVTLAEQTEYDITFSANADRMCETTRSVLPPSVLQVIDGLGIDGAYTIKDGHLWLRHTGHQPLVRFNGTAILRNAVAQMGVPITEANGKAFIQAQLNPDSPWAKSDLRFELDSLRVADRVVSPLTLHIATGERHDKLDVQRLNGQCYGGALLGSGTIDLGKDARYRLNLTVQDVALAPFLDPREHDQSSPPTDGVPMTPPSGSLAASLNIEGSPGQDGKRRGRGELAIRNASIYQVPLAMALMHVLNLRLPGASGFDQASASYLLDDDIVHLDQLQLNAPTMEISGAGTMNFDTLELDLNMRTRNPATPTLGPLTGLFTVFKDELLNIHVAGTLTDPKPRIESFSGIKRSWQGIFGESKEYAREATTTNLTTSTLKPPQADR